MALSVDVPTALVVMALVTFATRIGGFLVMIWIPLSARVQRFLEALSGSVLVALVLPMAIHGDLAGQLALLVAATTMLATRNSVAAIAAAMIAVVALRALG
ncbi:MAG: AzlD domain-containing protein [Kiloniellales bacterium]